jgi:hypothetical protein
MGGTSTRFATQRNPASDIIRYELIYNKLTGVPLCLPLCKNGWVLSPSSFPNMDVLPNVDWGVHPSSKWRVRADPREVLAQRNAVHKTIGYSECIYPTGYIDPSTYDENPMFYKIDQVLVLIHVLWVIPDVNADLYKLIFQWWKAHCQQRILLGVGMKGLSICWTMGIGKASIAWAVFQKWTNCPFIPPDWGPSTFPGMEIVWYWHGLIPPIPFWNPQDFEEITYKT